MKLFISIFFIAFSFFSKAQFGNEWIDYSQQYYSFKVAKNGIYKLDYNSLNTAGFPISSTLSSEIQLWGFEKEQPIFIEDGGDNSIDPGDYILFYAKKNTTWLDSLMYEDPNHVANRYFPHYNDTITYFLSINNGGNNLRVISETDINYASYPENDYVLETSFNSHHSLYVAGFSSFGLSKSQYIEAEGWSSSRVNALSSTHHINTLLSTRRAYTGPNAPNATGIAVSSGASNGTGGSSGNHHLQVINMQTNTILEDLIFSGYQKNNIEFSIPPTELSNTNSNIRHNFVNDLGVSSDQQVVHFVEITYPRTTNLYNLDYFDCQVENGVGSKTHYGFTFLNMPAPHAFVIDNGIVRKLPITTQSGTSHIIFPNTASNNLQELIISDESEFISINDLSPVNGNGSFVNFSNYNFENASIIITNQLLWSAAQSYKNYRESVAGGSYNSLLIDIDELYLQFGGGVPKHIMGLRRFQHYAFMQSTDKPDHVFLIGKAIREATQGSASGHGMRTSPISYQQCLIPSFGLPASDILISANLVNNPAEPLIPVGRLAASTNQEVEDYLAKVQLYEQAQDPNSAYTISSKLWQKEVLHFGGGSNASEQASFKGYLNYYETILEDSLFGGNATSFFKTVSDPINPVKLTAVNENINNGVSFMTFFGHASPTGFDQNVDDPENWNNQGKFPIVIGNSCLTGNIHEPLVYSTSEDFVLIPEKGAIAFIANVNQGFPFGLDKYSSELFTLISKNNYGASLGEQIKTTCHNLNGLANNFSVGTALAQMTLHGDPALKPNPHNNPEIAIESAGVFITPELVDLTVDSIDVNIVLYNLGKSVTDSFTVEVKRFFPNNGGDSTYIMSISKLDYIDTVKVTLPLYANLGIGINKFEVRVDIPGVITEQYDEINNNQLTKSFLFDIDGIYPVWPYNYAVVPNDTITLKASTVNPFASLLNYRFEIDTTDLYNSPEYRQYGTTSLGGVIKANPNDWKNATNQNTPLLLKDSTAYFWRVSLDDPGNYNWQEFSFQYIKGKIGWGQDHFFQFKNNDFSSLNYDRNDRELTFNPVTKSIHCQVYGNANTLPEIYGTLWDINGGDPEDYDMCGLNPKLHVCVIDPNNLTSWGTRRLSNGILVNLNNNFGNSNDINGINVCRNRPEKYFSFEQHVPSQLVAFENMITNDIPDGHYVLIYSTRELSYDEWDNHSPQVYNIFQNIGSDSIQTGKPNVPYISFYQKGVPGSFKEVYGQYLDDYIEFDDTLKGYDNQGFETSTLIGPAKRWKSLYWKQYPQENPTNDSTRLKIYGHVVGGQNILLADTLFTENDSILNLNTIPNINQFTTLQLEMASYDLIGSTAAQLDRWHVLFDPVPEAAITSTNGYLLTSDSLQEGDKILVQFDIENISDYPMDSLLVNYWVEKSNHQLQPLAYPRQDSLRVNGLIQDTISIPTNGLSDLNSIWVEINPYTFNNIKDQPEMFHFNNIGQIPFKVSTDKENPILQVSFDNQFILNGDLVSPNSEVVISLKDENPFLLLDSEADTSLFGIYLTDPNGDQKRLNFRNSDGEPLLEWVPANANSKKFKIIHQGNFEEDGTYQLLVQGADKSGNISGDFDYTIEFEVEHQSSITNLMNYPNPFSSQTQFVFTLTGATVPDEFTIQILTVTGKLVRTITRHELGAMHIGRNITEYSWDGRDEFGDQLANGVYLYRVKTSINGETIEHRESGADDYITKGFGKMYLLR
ncbi:MAG: C25 family cysteine peptidase [Crocinitomicaceae bacterium]